MSDRGVALLCATAITITLVVMVMVSDLFIRSQDIPGTNASSWDATGSIALGATASLILVAFLRTK